MLFLRPEGSIARWAGWSMLGIDKKGWEGIHTLCCILFLISVALHLILNRIALLRYVSGGISGNRGFRIDLTVAAGLVAIVFALAVFRIPPASKVFEWRHAIKNGSSLVRIQPPEADFEKRNLKEISDFLGISMNQILGILNAKGIASPAPEDSLEKIARQNKMSPQDFFGLILRGIPDP